MFCLLEFYNMASYLFRWENTKCSSILPYGNSHLSQQSFSRKKKKQTKTNPRVNQNTNIKTSIQLVSKELGNQMDKAKQLARETQNDMFITNENLFLRETMFKLSERIFHAKVLFIQVRILQGYIPWVASNFTKTISPESKKAIKVTYRLALWF